jgi:Asp-tRNA(Asn)/Glu-tRNA(Gln) amidotransferase A subunit family amidase
MSQEITKLGAAELARAIAERQISAVEAVDACISRIEAVNPSVNAVVVPLFDDARERARQADRVAASERGPLHGVPVTVKECFDIAGTPSTVGVPSRASHRAESDAPLVARLKRSGAIVLGKTNVSQLLMYVETDNPVYGLTHNPWNKARSSGGSSGGEGAIVALRGSALGLGTDIGGSVRVPAHCCGIHSLKPTPGRLSVDGTVSVIGDNGGAAIPDSGGLLARHVGDLRLALCALSPRKTPASDGSALRVGYYDDNGYFPASPALRRAVHEAAACLRESGCDVAPFSPPEVPEATDLFMGFFGADRGARWGALLEDGNVDPRMKDLLDLTRAPNLLRPVIAAALRLGGQPRLARAIQVRCADDAKSVAELSRRHADYRARFASAMAAAKVDVLLCPPCIGPAFRHGSTKDLGPASVTYTSLFNLLAYPAGVVTTTSVRADEMTARPRSRERMMEAARLDDEGSEGLPVGVQIVAEPGREDRVLTVMEILERGATWRAPA